MANKELDLPPETEMQKLSREQTQGTRDRMAKEKAAYNKQINEIMEGLDVTEEEAENILIDRMLGKKKKKKKRPPSYKHGGKVYSRGSRKAKYNG